MTNSVLSKNALISASALAGVSVASILTLVSVDATSNSKFIAILLFSAALPFLASCIMLNVDDPDSERDESFISLALFFIGAIAALAGFTALLAHFSLVVAGIFFASCLLALLLSGNARMRYGKDAT